MKGLLEEDVPFFVRVQAHQKATKWLKCLEQNMKNTMTVILQCCVQARMEEGIKDDCYKMYHFIYKPKWRFFMPGSGCLTSSKI